MGMTYLSDGRLKAYQTVPLFKEQYVLIARDEIFYGAAKR